MTIKQRRMALGLSVKQLAAVLGCHPTHVRNMETDPAKVSYRAPSFGTLAWLDLIEFIPKDMARQWIARRLDKTP